MFMFILFRILHDANIYAIFSLSHLAIEHRLLYQLRAMRPRRYRYYYFMILFTF